MRALLIIVIALGCVWCGYWVVGSIALRNTTETWFARQGTGPVQARASDIAVQGFPNRFDLTVTDPSFADAVSGFGWNAPFVQLFSMTWKPWHLIAALPNSQTLTTPDQTITLGTASMLASLKMVPGTALALDAIVVDAQDLVATSNLGWEIRAARTQLATRQDAGRANGHQVNVTVTTLIPDPGLMAQMAATSDLPPKIEVAQLDVTAGFSKPIDRFAGQSLPRLTSLNVTQGHLRWGEFELTLDGAVAADADGLAEGRIDITLTNWRRILAPAVAMGLITPEIAATVENMMALMAQQSGDPAVLNLPLVMAAGRMSLGPLPLGAAPRMIAGPQG